MNTSTLTRVLQSIGGIAVIAPLALMAGCLSAPADAGVADGNASALTENGSGDGTFYAKVSDGGNCSYGHVDSPLFGAMNHTDYDNSGACGACAEVSGPDGSVKIQIVDQCPECKPGDIDLSEDAFSALASLDRGRIPISWHYVPCEVQGPVVYRYKEGSSKWWGGVQVKNSPHAIAKFEYQKDGEWHEVHREPYNYFIVDSGFGDPPYAFRVTDVKGDVIEDHDIPLLESGDTPGKSQFPVRD